MAEKKDRRSKRFKNTQKKRDVSAAKIEHVYLQASYTMNDQTNPNINIQFDRTLCVLPVTTNFIKLTQMTQRHFIQPFIFSD